MTLKISDNNMHFKCGSLIYKEKELLHALKRSTPPWYYYTWKRTKYKILYYGTTAFCTTRCQIKIFYLYTCCVIYDPLVGVCFAINRPIICCCI